MNNKKYELIIISDLHLSEGWNPVTKRLSRNEDFFFDLSFQRFLQHLAGRAERGGFFYKLIINGDFVDFLQFTSVPDQETIDGEKITKREKELGLGTSTIKTLWKLNILMKGHWIFFYALKEFISRGNEVIIIPGNHDIEWIIPEVQKRFKEKLSDDIPEDKKAEFIDRIQFVPWFYYDPHAFLHKYIVTGTGFQGHFSIGLISILRCQQSLTKSFQQSTLEKDQKKLGKEFFLREVFSLDVFKMTGRFIQMVR